MKYVNTFSRSQVFEAGMLYATYDYPYSVVRKKFSVGGVSTDVFRQLVARAIVEHVIDDAHVTRIVNHAIKNASDAAGVAAGERIKKHYEALIKKRNDFKELPPDEAWRFATIYSLEKWQLVPEMAISWHMPAEFGYKALLSAIMDLSADESVVERILEKAEEEGKINPGYLKMAEKAERRRREKKEAEIKAEAVKSHYEMEQLSFFKPHSLEIKTEAPV